MVDRLASSPATALLVDVVPYNPNFKIIEGERTFGDEPNKDHFFFFFLRKNKDHLIPL